MPRIRAEAIEAIPLSIPLKKPMKMSGVTHTVAETVVVRVKLDTGICGWGEAPAAPTMTGDTREGIVGAVRHLGSFLIGREIDDMAEIAPMLKGWIRGNAGARSAIEMALLDAMAKTHDVSLFTLFDSQETRLKLDALYLLGNADTAEDAREASERYGDGCRIFKLKVGIDPVDIEIERVHAIRATLGADAILGVDANGGLSGEDTSRFCEGIADCDVAFIEQPLPPGMEHETSVLARNSRIPFALDESVSTLDDLQFLAREVGFRGASLKSIKFGGLSALRTAVSFCKLHGLSVNLANKVAETSISSAALAHAAAALPEPEWGVSLTHSYLATDVCTEPVVVTGGQVQVPSATPGLGIEVNERSVERFRVQL